MGNLYLSSQRSIILWIAKGKTQIVYDFIDYVGLDWMEGVETVPCDKKALWSEGKEGAL